MARRVENECAYCAEEVTLNASHIGQDWKVYCCPACLSAGEQLSAREIFQLMALVTDRRAWSATETRLR